MSFWRRASFCRPVYGNRTDLRVHELLTAVETVISAEHVADRGSNAEQQKVVAAEKFDAQKDTAHRTVDDAAEKGDQADLRSEGGVDTEKRRHRAAEGGADKHRRDDLAAFESGARRSSCHEHFYGEGGGRRGACQGGGDDGGSASVIIARAGEQCQDDDDDASGDDAQIVIGNMFFVKRRRRMHHLAENDAEHRA